MYKSDTDKSNAFPHKQTLTKNQLLFFCFVLSWNERVGYDRETATKQKFNEDIFVL